jgi:acyl-CoA thioester hydrolase
VTASLERVSKLRFGFLQNIFRLPDHKPILKAKVFGTSLNAAGQPKYFQEVEKLFS